MGGDSLRGQEDEVVVVTAPRRNMDYTLGSGDKLRVTVYGEDDLSGEFQIDGAGTLRLPLIGQVRAAGLTAPELETRVEQALDSGYLLNARVAIEVTTYRPIYIIGQVNKPGEYAYVSNMSALNAIALAGGFTEKAVESTIFVRHEGEAEEHPLAADDLTRISPGDVLRVRETFFWSVSDVLSPLTGIGYIAATAS
jgi:polysaccharide export outer membrane protein